MAAELRVPKTEDTQDGAVLVRWLKPQGDSVERDEAVVELEMDKSVTSLKAPATGTLQKHLADEGDILFGGDVIAFIGESGETAPTAARRSGES